jgi:hypothetical protein
MEVIMKQQYRFWLIGVVVLAVIAAVAFTGGNAVGPEQNLALHPPAFVQAASSEASRTSAEIAAKLSNEAGISAYYQTSSEIDLNQIRGEFNTIEVETADYILGSVSVPDYPEIYDAHVYVHADGWIMAYYFNSDPVSKIVDVSAGSIETTKLESVVATMAGLAGMPFTEAVYYDFRYPNATHMMLIAENYDGGDNEFTVQLPSSFGYHERSWALRNYGSPAYFNINGANKTSSAMYWDGVTGYGFINVSELLADTTHTITVDDYGVLVILYRVP